MRLKGHTANLDDIKQKIKPTVSVLTRQSNLRNQTGQPMIHENSADNK